MCTEGEPGHELYLIAAGEAAVERGGHTVTKLHTGDYFGELALLDRGPRSATVRALSDTRLYVLGEASFAAVLNEVPALAQKLLAVAGHPATPRRGRRRSALTAFDDRWVVA